MLPSARRRSAQNCFPREPLDQARAAVVSSALGVTVGSNHAWVWSAQNRLTRVPLGQGRVAVVSSALGVTGGSNHAWVWSAQNRLTRVPRGQGRAAVVSSALGVTGGTIQRAVAPSSTAPALSVYGGTLACRQRVKRFRAVHAARARWA
jgi:hypothetical protein